MQLCWPAQTSCHLAELFSFHLGVLDPMLPGWRARALLLHCCCVAKLGSSWFTCEEQPIVPQHTGPSTNLAVQEPKNRAHSPRCQHQTNLLTEPSPNKQDPQTLSLQATDKPCCTQPTRGQQQTTSGSDSCCQQHVERSNVTALTLPSVSARCCLCGWPAC